MSGRPARLDALIDVLDRLGDVSTRTALRMHDGSDGPARLVFTSSGSRVVLPGGHAGSPSPAQHRALTLAPLFGGLFSPVYGFRSQSGDLDARLSISINVL